MSDLTPEQKVKYLIAAWGTETPLDYEGLTGDRVEAAYQELVDADEHWDGTSEVRGGEVETNIPCEYSRHYEAKSVASMMPDGSWVGWTYWYGGGKHGEPEAVDWIEYAYDLDCTEEEKVTVVQTFTKKPEAK